MAIVDPDLVSEFDVVVGPIRRSEVTAGCVSLAALSAVGLKNDHMYSSGRDENFAERAEVAAVEPEGRLTGAVDVDRA